jgi:hypothetical protein
VVGGADYDDALEPTPRQQVLGEAQHRHRRSSHLHRHQDGAGSLRALETEAEVMSDLARGKGILGVHVVVRGNVPGATPEQFA